MGNLRPVSRKDLVKIVTGTYEFSAGTLALLSSLGLAEALLRAVASQEGRLPPKAKADAYSSKTILAIGAGWESWQAVT